MYSKKALFNSIVSMHRCCYCPPLQQQQQQQCGDEVGGRSSCEDERAQQWFLGADELEEQGACCYTFTEQPSTFSLSLSLSSVLWVHTHTPSRPIVSQ